LLTTVTVATGFTVMVKDEAVPLHVFPFVKAGVTVIVAVTGAVPAFVPVKDAISPVPLAANPIDGVLLVQLYTIEPPVVGLLKLTADVTPLLHTV
jgi:hypothetical protein